MKIVRIAEIKESERAALFVGRDHGADVSFFITSHPRRGPTCTGILTRRRSRAGGHDRVHRGRRDRRGRAGTIVVVPAGAIHNFKAASDSVTRQVNIHPVAEMVTEWIQ